MADTTDDVRQNGPVSALPAVDASTVESSTQPEGSSDGEGEKSARERLKKTSIAGLSQKSKDATQGSGDHALAQSTSLSSADTDSNGNRGRPAKKRSFEDLARGENAGTDNGEIAQQPNPKSGHHKRMRSRDVASGEHSLSKYEGDKTSPLREEEASEAQTGLGDSRDTVDDTTDQVMVEGKEPVSASQSQVAPQDVTASTKDTDPPTLATETIQAEGTTGGSSGSSRKDDESASFANASSTSPFGTVKSPTQPPTKDAPLADKKTSPSAFASSGLSAFANSEKSPFGASATTSSGFGSNASTGGFGAPSSGFGSGSAFGSKASTGFGSSTGGFGSGSGFGSSTGFGSAKPFGSGLSSFAGSSGVTGAFGTGKPFGVSKDKDEEDESDDEENESGHKEEDEVQDDRFVAQDVETGEEAEDTVFQCRAKLFHFEKEWKERGVGTIKINVSESVVNLDEADTGSEDIESGRGGRSTERRGRLIMRTDGVHRVILNTPIFKAMRVGQSDGSEPVGKTMHLTGLEDGKPALFQIKIGKEEAIKELYRKVLDLRQEAKV